MHVALHAGKHTEVHMGIIITIRITLVNVGKKDLNPNTLNVIIVECIRLKSAECLLTLNLRRLLRHIHLRLFRQSVSEIIMLMEAVSVVLVSELDHVLRYNVHIGRTIITYGCHVHNAS